ncbi:MAG: hypothetical protein RBT71_03035 [Flavobacteriales bacterium]|jgi:hypothetical protein|nr:hypothetical protein [Flavobacteriales bacterium]
MLKALLLSLTTLALAATATAQNLVPNGSFEDTVNCEVQGLYSLLTAEHWSSPNMATPDVYDCDLDRRCGEPMDPDDLQGVVIQGFQYAHHGLRFAAGFQWYGPGVPPEQDTREYLMIRLTDAMEVGRSYAVSLFYSRAEGYRYAIDHLGVYFGSDSVFETHPVVLGLAPQVALRDPLSPYLTEGEAWVQLTDTFVAAGGEQWMVIGTFNGSDDVDGIEATPSSSYAYAYYYIDQVSVVPLAPSGIPEWVAWYAGNGSIGVHWRGVGPLERLRLFDPSGRLLMESSPQWVGGPHALALPGSLATGVYMLEGWSGGRRWVTRFVKEEGMF